MEKPRLRAAVERFLAWAAVNNKPATVAVYRLYLERFVRFFGDVPLAKLTPANVTTWSQKFHPVQAVQRLLAWCHKEERSIASNPLEGMRKLKTGVRLRILSPEETLALLRGTDRAFRPFLVALRESIARPQEIRAVRPCDIRAAGGRPATEDELLAGEAFFELGAGKGFERRSDQSSVRIIPISPRLGRLLDRLLRHDRAVTEPIFRNGRGRPWTANAVRCRLRRLRVRIGLEADARGERVVAYSFRHTGATAAAAAGLRDFTLARVLGHASTRTTARYVHLQAADVIDGMKRVWEMKASFRPKNDRPRLRRTHPD